MAPHVAILKTQAETIRSLVVRTAEKVPENLYDFKPTPEVRSIAALRILRGRRDRRDRTLLPHEHHELPPAW